MRGMVASVPLMAKNKKARDGYFLYLKIGDLNGFFAYFNFRQRHIKTLYIRL